MSLFDGDMVRHGQRKTSCGGLVKARQSVSRVLRIILQHGLSRYAVAAPLKARCRRSTRLSLLILLLLGAGEWLLADGLSEEQIKAAYLYNFAKFVEWPTEALPAGAEMVLCAVGNNVLDGALDDLNGRNIGERAMRVEYRSFSDRMLTGCHLLFIGRSEQTRFMVILKTLGNAPVLTLSDIADFAEKGGGIGLRFRDNKVVFEVNLEAIRHARLHLPSQLLNIASHVYGR